MFKLKNLTTTLCDKVCEWLVAGLWFSPCTPVSSTNKTDHHDITEILLKVALNTINQPTHFKYMPEITVNSWWNVKKYKKRRYKWIHIYANGYLGYIINNLLYTNL